MTPTRLFALCLAAVAVAACGDEGLGPPPPVGGLRFINAVADTGAMDFRVVDIVGDAPQLLENAFRALTPYQAVQAGTRHLKVFMTPSRTDTTVGSPLVWDTSFTFAAGANYSVIMTGLARTGSSPSLRMLIITDDAPTPAVGQIGIRVVNVGSGLGAVDAFTRTGVESPPGASLLTNLAFGSAGSYSARDTARLSVAVTAAGSLSHLTLAGGPRGVAGIAGMLIPGSVLTALIVPPSVVGSAAPQGGRPAAIAIQLATRSNDTVTVRSGTRSVLTNRSPTAADSVVGTTGVASGVTGSDVVFVSGAAEAEYNDWQSVLGGADSLASCTPTDPGDTSTRCNATNVIATTHFRFRYRMVGTPASPATGTPVYRIYPVGSTSDYTSPAILYLSDRRP
ncbi:MAG: DUF4397 domain-containing protein [Gemmatimonadales bacterium]